ncbi:hypothetical protein [Chloroflexus sp.]
MNLPPILTHRVVRAYLVIALGALLFWLRRIFLPTFFELQGVMFDIAVPSALNSCYNRPALATCSDAVIVVLTVFGVVAAVGWGNLAMTVFALILAIPPLALYFALSPIWPPLIALAFIPIALELGLWFLFPRQSDTSNDSD